MTPKEAAGETAAALVEDGMLVGLGSGSTAACFIDALGRRVADGLRITAVSSSIASADQARALGIDVVERVDRVIDLTVDGADEIDPQLDLVKGLGGALLREKVVAAASARMVVVATEDKLVDRLGRGPLPVEVLPFLWETTAWRLDGLKLRPVRRGGDASPFVSDNGNFILDCTVPHRRSAARLAPVLETIPGVVGHGLFLNMASLALIADDHGQVRQLHRT